MRKEELRACYKRAKEIGAEIVGVIVEIDEDKTSELILNKKDNFDNKMKYYDKAYDENLHLKDGPIKIIGVFIAEAVGVIGPEYFGDTSHWEG